VLELEDDAGAEVEELDDEIGAELELGVELKELGAELASLPPPPQLLAAKAARPVKPKDTPDITVCATGGNSPTSASVNSGSSVSVVEEIDAFITLLLCIGGLQKCEIGGLPRKPKA